MRSGALAWWGGLLALIIAAPGAPTAQALEASAAVTYEAEYTTNSARTSADEVEEWIHRPGAEVSASHDGPSGGVDLQYNVYRRMHGEDTFDDETVATGSAGLQWNVVPERWILFARNTRTDTTRNSRDINNPANRQTTDDTEVGTSLFLDSISNHQIELTGSYSLTNAEETRTDSDRVNGSLGYIVPLSPSRTLVLRASHTDVDFDDEFSPDYDAESFGLEYSSQTRVLTWSINGGYQSTDLDGRDEVNGVIGSIDGSYSLSERTAISLSASRSIDDNFDGRQRGTIRFVEDFGLRTDTNEVATRDSVDVRFNSAGERNNFGLSASFSQQDFEADVGDEERVRAGLDYGRQLTRASTLDFSVFWEQREFEDSTGDDDEIRARLQYSINAWRRLSLNFSVGYSDRSSDRNVGDADEWQYVMGLRYIVFGATR